MRASGFGAYYAAKHRKEIEFATKTITETYESWKNRQPGDNEIRNYSSTDWDLPLCTRDVESSVIDDIEKDARHNGFEVKKATPNSIIIIDERTKDAYRNEYSHSNHSFIQYRPMCFRKYTTIDELIHNLINKWADSGTSTTFVLTNIGKRKSNKLRKNDNDIVCSLRRKLKRELESAGYKWSQDGDSIIIINKLFTITGEQDFGKTEYDYKDIKTKFDKLHEF